MLVKQILVVMLLNKYSIDPFLIYIVLTEYVGLILLTSYSILYRCGQIFYEALVFMSTGSLLIRGVRLISSSNIKDGIDILVIDGRVEALGRGLSRPNGVEVLDAKGLLAFPGAVDEHVHMREPGLEYKDDFLHGTMAAAAGGVTTVLEMPNTLPPVENKNILLEKAKHLSGKAYVDFGLYGVVHDGNIDEFEELVYSGAVGFKIFLGPTTGNIPAPNDGTLIEALSKSAKMNVPIAFHAENWDLVKYFTEKVKATGRMDPTAHTDARPPICEEEAIQRLILYSKHTGGRVLIVHMSAKEGVELLRRAKELKLNVWGETNPHYLLLTVKDYEKYGVLIKVNPPIRDESHQRELWRAVLDGTITHIGSDHAPHSREEKEKNVWEASAGFHGVRTLVPLMIDQALRGRLPLTKIPELLSENPARLFNIYPRKGTLTIGSDADIILVDPRGETVLREEDLYAKNPLSPFIGWKLRGIIKYVILRGTIIAKNGKIVVEKPLGEWIKPVR